MLKTCGKEKSKSMNYGHSERAGQILEDLVKFTGKPAELVKSRCKIAVVELAWLWHFKKDILSFYRDTDLYIFDLTAYQSMIVPEVNYMIEYIEKHKIKKILDLGGGIGEYTIRILQETKANVTFLELKDSKTLEYAKWRFKKHKVNPAIVFEDFLWKNESWDAVIAMDVLEHLENANEMIADLERKAKFVFANPEKIKFNELYPQHISAYQLANFTEIGVNLYKNKKE